MGTDIERFADRVGRGALATRQVVAEIGAEGLVQLVVGDEARLAREAAFFNHP